MRIQFRMEKMLANVPKNMIHNLIEAQQKIYNELDFE